MVTLRVNISDPYGFIRRLAWFHNGTEVAANCTSGRFTVNTMGTELNIIDATSGDSGVYTVRVSSLDIYGYQNSEQDSLAPAAKRVCPGPNAAPVSGLLVMRDNVRCTAG